jgi:crossover junction endodeoxyribonuclease RuvC
MADAERIILGIDPGTNLLGFGVIRVLDRKPEFVDMGVLDMRKDNGAFEKLLQIHDTVIETCKTYRPTEIALESPIYRLNAQSLIKLSRAQGAAVIAAMEYGITPCEYAPSLAKQAITGNGAASKTQVANVLKSTLGFDIKPEHLDATDALAIAMCHFYQTANPLASSGSGSGSWKKFLRDHPDRVK